jgi:thiamine monophosphate synthase
LFINDSGSIAQAAHAGGVHRADCREPCRSSTRAAGAPLLVGKSVNGMDSAKEATGQGAERLIGSNVFESHYDSVRASESRPDKPALRRVPGARARSR